MSNSELPDSLLRLIQYCLPSFPAAELLVFLAEHAEVSWSNNAIIEALQPRAFNASSVAQYLTFFKSRGLVEEQLDGRFVYRPASPELADAVATLILAFNQRPVTLIRSIYALVDHPMQSFADAFRIKDD